MGVETVAVVATPVERARQYFRHRPPRCLVGADPDLASHRAFGVPRTDYSEEIGRAVTANTDRLAREVGLEAPPGGGMAALDRADGVDAGDYASDLQRHQAQLTGHFLIGQDGLIRWTDIECARDGLVGLNRHPTEEELLTAARAL